MIYPDFKFYLAKYTETKLRMNDLIDEKEELFQMTQPRGVDSQKEAVSGGKNGNMYEAYMIRKEETHIEERILEMAEILKYREELLKDAEKRLRDSVLLEDRIYKMRYLDRMRVFKIARKLNYSESQVYRILEKINRTDKDARKCEKKGDIK